MTWLGAALLAARIFPLVALAPFLGGGLPLPVRFSLALALSVALWPFATVVGPVGPLLGLALILKEAAIGAALGYTVSLVFAGVRAAGRIADESAGLTGLGSLYGLLAVVVFFAIDGHRLFLAAVGRSYEVLPAGVFPEIEGLAPLAAFVLRLTAEFFVIALGLAAPVLAALLLADLTLGFVGRLAPELGGALVALPARVVATIGVTAAALLLFVEVIIGRLGQGAAQTDTLLRLLAR